MLVQRVADEKKTKEAGTNWCCIIEIEQDTAGGNNLIHWLLNQLFHIEIVQTCFKDRRDCDSSITVCSLFLLD